MNASVVGQLHLSKPAATDQPPQAQSLGLMDCQTLMLRHSPSVEKHLPVLMLHGIQSHPGWFSPSACALADGGHAVYQFQRRGSGSATIGRGHARSPRQLLDDLDAAVRHVLADTGAAAVHLLGISWGGKYALCYALDRPGGPVKSLTLVAPGLAPRVRLPLATRLAVAVCAMIAPSRTFEIPLNDPALFTDNEQMRRYIRTDPHRLTRATASFMLTSRRMDWMLAGAPDKAIDLPVALVLADRDRIIDNAATGALMRRLAGRGLWVIELAGAHTLEFEPDPTPLYQALAEALRSHEHAGGTPDSRQGKRPPGPPSA